MIEPSLRYTNILSIDFRSVKASELNFIHNYPNGFESSEICSIARYAGMSDRISCVGVFEVFQNSISSALLAQAVWYFIEGFSLRIIEDPKSENFKGKSYHMDLENHQILNSFYSVYSNPICLIVSTVRLIFRRKYAFLIDERIYLKNSIKY